MDELRFEDLVSPLPGFRDLAGTELQIQRLIEARLSELFRAWAYEEISVPIVERASSFSEEVVGGSPWPEWDRRGVFYIHMPRYSGSYSNLPEQDPALLIPEGTISVSRWIAKQHSSDQTGYPRKLFYILPCFRNELLDKLGSTKRRQFHQAGVEILGSTSLRADLEILLLAAKGMSNFGIPPDKLLARIGSVEIFNALIAATGVSSSDTLTLKDLLDTIAEAKAGKEPDRLDPSRTRAYEILSTYSQFAELRERWELVLHTQTPELTGQAAELLGFPEQVAELNLVAAAARELGLRTIIDLTVVRSHEYYTGIVYEIDVHLEERPPLVEVAGGGRYNRLVGHFFRDDQQLRGTAIPSVGFAYGIERLAELLREGRLLEARPQQTLTYSLDDTKADILLLDTGTSSRVHLEADRLRKQGHRVDVYAGVEDDENTTNQYQERVGAKERRSID